MESIFIDYGLLHFFYTSLKIHFVMTIQKIFQKIIQCDYSIYIIVMLSPLLSYLFIFNHIAHHEFQNLAKTAL
jgi:hypothetical protein